jgi:hypothetical protein
MNQNQYQIFQISANDFQLNSELGGYLEKGWIEEATLGKVLFKKAVNIEELLLESRTDWSEKVGAELSALLDLPAARYEFASLVEDKQEIPGTLSISLIQPGDIKRISLNEFLERDNSQYTFPSDYQISRVLQALADNNIDFPPYYRRPDGIKDAADMLVGVVLLDTLIGNVDRHDENLEIVICEDGTSYLSPIFDNGNSLAAFEDNDFRSYTLADYYGEHSTFSSFEDRSREIKGITAFQQAAELRPEAAEIWLNQLAKIAPKQIQNIFTSIPSDRITPEASKFAQELLKYNQKQLLNYQQELSNNLQQRRVDKIAPILIDYLRLNQKAKVENIHTIVEYNPESKMLIYQNRGENQYLKAQLNNGKWVDVGSNISSKKESQLVNEIAPKVRQKLKHLESFSLKLIR